MPIRRARAFPRVSDAAKLVVAGGVCLDFLYMSVCEVDETFQALVGGEALTERHYLDDGLAEDIYDVGARPVFGRLVVRIEPVPRRWWPRPLVCLTAAVLAGCVVYAVARSRGAHRHRTSTVVRRTAHVRTFHRETVVVRRRLSRGGRRVHRQRVPHRDRATAAYPGSTEVPAVSASTQAAPAPAPVSPRVPAPAPHGEEFGLER